MRSRARGHAVAVTASVECRYCGGHADVEIHGNEFACPHCEVINEVDPDFLDRY
jgi:predicted RNA-binding Zn-ribbon protein involved in translation (DUF1610 family)